MVNSNAGFFPRRVQHCFLVVQKISGFQVLSSLKQVAILYTFVSTCEDLVYKKPSSTQVTADWPWSQSCLGVYTEVKGWGVFWRYTRILLNKYPKVAFDITLPLWNVCYNGQIFSPEARHECCRGWRWARWRRWNSQFLDPGKVRDPFLIVSDHDGKQM